MPNQASVEVLTDMIEEVEVLLSTTVPLPENRTPKCLELLRAAKAVSRDMAVEAEARSFGVVLQAVAKWRRTALGDAVEYGRRDRFLLELEGIAKDTLGPL